jgi:hypothetical protein
MNTWNDAYLAEHLVADQVLGSSSLTTRSTFAITVSVLSERSESAAIQASGLSHVAGPVLRDDSAA